MNDGDSAALPHPPEGDVAKRLEDAYRQIDRDNMFFPTAMSKLLEDGCNEIRRLKEQLSTARRTALLDGAKVAFDLIGHGGGVAEALRTLAEKEGLESRPEPGGEEMEAAQALLNAPLDYRKGQDI